jgi:hypothetical protein
VVKCSGQQALFVIRVILDQKIECLLDGHALEYDFAGSDSIGKLYVV